MTRPLMWPACTAVALLIRIHWVLADTLHIPTVNSIRPRSYNWTFFLSPIFSKFYGKPELFVYRAFIANAGIIILLLFNIVPFWFNALTPELDKRIDSAGEEIFRTGAQPLMYRRPNLNVVPELRSNQRIFQWTKDVKIRRRKVRWVRSLWDALKPQLFNSRHCCCNRMWLRIVVEKRHSRRQKLAPCLANSWLQIFPQNVWVGGTGHSASSGHVVL